MVAWFKLYENMKSTSHVPARLQLGGPLLLFTPTAPLNG